ncbi:NAD(P)(+)--arginine ADP-ribosyltransferase 2-like isoform X1 [Pygocentrus nattereri]|uniref:NAD(P)(+)--arginine ADP-ribosyltransferase n=2 Tax=Pygocentrus nattereri TaxID=42514 RepID=A0A3B4DZV9_PYGNA|nr:NAD(P)(+)--arginine ADP-ribosyltransferase 2-like isoform X1 [Pygocentrus nattereri]
MRKNLICMKMTMFVASVLFLMTLSLSVKQSISGGIQPLDMANNSVDDSFEGCRDAMYTLVMSKYIEPEQNATSVCSAAWNKSLANYTRNGLGVYQSAAISMYTDNCIYAQFNRASRNGSAAYQSGDFQFYTLHFFLTDAIQQLKEEQTECVTSYRRTNVKFETGVLNKTVRFGSFTSSSLIKSLKEFGEESCFQIYTCFGAAVEKFSAFKNEKEVIIPPYETFLVTNVEKRHKRNNLWCKVVYELRSAGKRSNLQCIKNNRSSTLVPSLLSTFLLFTALSAT